MLTEYIASTCFEEQCVLVGKDFNRGLNELDEEKRIGESVSILWSLLPISRPIFLKQIGLALAERARERSIDLFVGVAVSGVPFAIAASMCADLPFVLVRSTPKSHGDTGMLVGQCKHGMRAMVVENFVNTGRSALKATEYVSRLGVEVTDIACVEFGDFLPMLPSMSNYRFYHLTTLREKLALMNTRGYFPGRLFSYVIDYIENPEMYYVGSAQYTDFIRELERAPDYPYLVRSPDTLSHLNSLTSSRGLV